MTQTISNPKRWAALGFIALAQFMVIMDTSIIAVALPDTTIRQPRSPEPAPVEPADAPVGEPATSAR